MIYEGSHITYHHLDFDSHLCAMPLLFISPFGTAMLVLQRASCVRPCSGAFTLPHRVAVSTNRRHFMPAFDVNEASR